MKLFANGKELGFDQKLKLSITYKNDLFNQGAMSITATDRFVIPNTAQNRIALGIEHPVQASSSVLKIIDNFIIEERGQAFFGSAEIKTVNDKYINIKANLGQSKFYRQLRDTLMSEIPLKLPNVLEKPFVHIRFSPTHSPDWISVALYRTPVVPSTAGQFYVFTELFDTDVNTTLNRIAARINGTNPRPIPTHDSAQAYADFTPDNLGITPTYVQSGGKIYQANYVNVPAGTAITNTSFWIEYLDDIDFATNGDLDVNFRELYDQLVWPTVRTGFEAEVIGNDIIIYDSLLSPDSSPDALNFISIQDQSWSYELSGTTAKELSSLVGQTVSPYTGPENAEIANYANTTTQSVYGTNDTIVFFPVYNPDSDNRIFYSDYNSNFNATQGNFTTSNNFQTQHYFQAAYYVFEILRKILAHFGYDLQDAALDQTKYEDWKRLVMWCNATVIGFVEKSRQAVEQGLPFEDFSINETFPDIPCIEFYYGITSCGWIIDWDHDNFSARLIAMPDAFAAEPVNFERFNFIRYDVNDQEFKNRVRLEFDVKNDNALSNAIPEFDRKYIVSELDAVADLPVSPNSPFDIYLIKSLNEYYYLELQQDETYTPVSMGPNFDSFGAEAQSKKYKIYFNSMMMIVRQANGYNWRVPYIIQEGFYPGVGKTVKNYGLIFLFYYGLKKNANNDDYPYASSDNYDLAGNKIADHTLSLNGEFGLTEKMLKEFVHLLNTADEFSVLLPLSALDIYNVKSYKKYLIWNTQWFIETMNVEFPLNKMVRLTLWKYIPRTE